MIVNWQKQRQEPNFGSFDNLLIILPFQKLCITLYVLAVCNIKIHIKIYELNMGYVWHFYVMPQNKWYYVYPSTFPWGTSHYLSLH